MLQKVSCAIILLIFIATSSINPEPNLNVIKEKVKKTSFSLFWGNGTGEREQFPSFFPPQRLSNPNTSFLDFSELTTHSYELCNLKILVIELLLGAKASTCQFHRGPRFLAQLAGIAN